MKEKELRKHATCNKCGELIGKSGVPMFFTLHIERHGINLDAVRRQDGLAAMLGGNAMLANVMGTDEEMTMPMMEPVDITLCEKCAVEQVNIFVLSGME